MEYYSELLSFCTLKWDSFKIESPVLLKLSCDGAFLGRIDFWFPGSGDHANLPIASGTGRTGDVGNIQCAVS